MVNRGMRDFGVLGLPVIDAVLMVDVSESLRGFRRRQSHIEAAGALRIVEVWWPREAMERLWWERVSRDAAAQVLRELMQCVAAVQVGPMRGPVSQSPAGALVFGEHDCWLPYQGCAHGLWRGRPAACREPPSAGISLGRPGTGKTSLLNAVLVADQEPTGPVRFAMAREPGYRATCSPWAASGLLWCLDPAAGTRRVPDGPHPARTPMPRGTTACPGVLPTRAASLPRSPWTRAKAGGGVVSRRGRRRSRPCLTWVSRRRQRCARQAHRTVVPSCRESAAGPPWRCPQAAHARPKGGLDGRGRDPRRMRAYRSPHASLLGGGSDHISVVLA
jgi:hypothetical protein